MEEQNNNIQKENKLGTVILTIVLTIFCIACVVIGIQVGIKWAKEDYENQTKVEEKQSTNNEQEENTNEKETENTDENQELTLNEFANVFKTYLSTLDTTLYDPENIQEFGLTSVTELGYYENDSKTEYVYSVRGYFICKDKSETCIYQSQVDSYDTATGQVPYYVKVYATKENNTIIINNIATGTTEAITTTNIELK